jgi:dienelactone hydrolase
VICPWPVLFAECARRWQDLDPPNPLWPKSPTQHAPEMKAPVLGLYGEADTGISVAAVEAMKAALAANKKTAEFKIYPGAPHGFHADYRQLSQGSGRRRLGPDAGLVQEIRRAELSTFAGKQPTRTIARNP